MEQEFGPVELLAAFAGGGIIKPGPAEKVTEQEWHSVLDGNLTATFLTVKSFLPGMIERRSGSIVTMASTAGRLPSQAPVPYSAAKAGILMFSRNLANEVAQFGIRVNALMPGTILTPFVERYLKESYADPEEGMASIRKRQLSSELGRPEDVAGAALYLASDESKFVMASGLVIDGGMTGAK